MNTLLLVALVISGAVDLFVGAVALVKPEMIAQWTINTPLDRFAPLVRLIGTAALGSLALHILAFQWMRSEKREANSLAIVIGCAAAACGLLTAAFSGFAVQLAPFAVDVLRGAFLAVAAAVAMNSPSVVRKLDLPAQARAQSRDAGRSQQHGSRGGRDSRDRDYRGRGRDRDRALAPSGAGERSRGSWNRQDRPDRRSQQPVRSERQEGAPRPSRDQDRRGRETAPPRPAARTETREPLQVRPLPTEEGASESRDRWSDRRTPAVATTQDPRPLGVVVTGRPPIVDTPRERTPDRESDRERDRGRGRDRMRGRDRDGGRRESAEEKRELPRAPMVPPVIRTDMVQRPLRSEGSLESQEGDEDRDMDRRSRSRGRRRGRDGRSRDRRPGEPMMTQDAGIGEEPVTPEYIPAPEPEVREALPMHEHEYRSETRSEPRSEPRYESRSEPRYEPRPEPREPRRTPEPEYRESRRAPDREIPVIDSDADIPESTGPVLEPIDRISSFGGKDDEHSAPTKQPYGNTRRPWTPTRKSKQSKPREPKVRQVLGGTSARDVRDMEPTEEPERAETTQAPALARQPSSPTPGSKGRGGTSLSSEGIGPIDMEEFLQGGGDR